MGWSPMSSPSTPQHWNDLPTAGSVVSCLPGAMGDPQTAATGAVMRPSVLRQYALQAGFGEVEVLPIHTDFWRFYRLLR